MSTRTLAGSLLLAALGTSALHAQPGQRLGIAAVQCPSGPLEISPAAETAAAALGLATSEAGDQRDERFREARQRANAAIQQSPRAAYGYHLAGMAALGLRDHADAGRLLRRAIELCPGLAEFDGNRLLRGAAALAVEAAAARLVAGDTVGALTDYDTALRLDPDHYPAPFYVGLIAFVRQDTDEAVEQWERVIAILDRLPADTSAAVMGERADTRANTLNALVLASAQYLQREQPAPAAELLGRLTGQLPHNPEAWYNYALALNSLRRWEEVARAAQRAAELAPLSYGAQVLVYNGYAGQSQAASAAGDSARAGTLGRQAREIGRRSESLPVQLEGIAVDAGPASVSIAGTAVGTGSTAPVQVEFIVHGASGVLGTGRTTIVPPARDERRRFELSIPASGAILGVAYRVVP